MIVLFLHLRISYFILFHHIVSYGPISRSHSTITAWPLLGTCLVPPGRNSPQLEHFLSDHRTVCNPCTLFLWNLDLNIVILIISEALSQLVTHRFITLKALLGRLIVNADESCGSGRFAHVTRPTYRL